MKKLVAFGFLLVAFLLIGIPQVLAVGLGEVCKEESLDNNGNVLRVIKDEQCNKDLTCAISNTQDGLRTSTCVTRSVTDLEKVIGKIEPPNQIKNLVDKGGAGGLSFFLNKVIELIYVIASIIFVFMVIISAVQWILSGGDKEKVAAARNRLTFAVIGIVLLAVAFVIIGVIGRFTGFTFFEGQNPTPPPFIPPGGGSFFGYPSE